MTPSAPRCARPPGTATGAARSPRAPGGMRRDQPACAAAGAGRGAGPRPIRPVFLATSTREIAHYTARFIVRPGMTGLAQLRGGYFTHPRDKLRYDLLYIRNRSFWLDFRLVAATFVKLLNRWLTLGVVLGLMFLRASFAP